MIDEESKNMIPAIKMKLASEADLIRMAFFSAARNNGLNFLYFSEKEKWYLGFLTGVAGYYQLRGVPMFFYIEIKSIPKDQRFMKYSAKEKEKWGYADSTEDPARWNYLPIIELAEKPPFF